MSRCLCETWGFSAYARKLFSSGRLNENTDPLPNWLTTLIVPPCASTITFAIAKPHPCSWRGVTLVSAPDKTSRRSATARTNQFPDHGQPRWSLVCRPSTSLVTLIGTARVGILPGIFEQMHQHFANARHDPCGPSANPAQRITSTGCFSSDALASSMRGLKRIAESHAAAGQA